MTDLFYTNADIDVLHELNAMPYLLIYARKIDINDSVSRCSTLM